MGSPGVSPPPLASAAALGPQSSCPSYSHLCNEDSHCRQEAIDFARTGTVACTTGRVEARQQGFLWWHLPELLPWGPHHPLIPRALVVALPGDGQQVVPLSHDGGRGRCRVVGPGLRLQGRSSNMSFLLDTQKTLGWGLPPAPNTVRDLVLGFL